MFEDLKNYIQSIVRANGNEEITGTNMQQVLLQMVDIIGSPQFRGVASPATDPGDPVGPAIYITATAGEYINFGNLEIAQGELAVLLWNGAAWIKQTITTIVSNVFVRDSKDVPFIQHLMQLKGSQEQEITILAKANGIVVGGLVSWSGQGLTFNISYVFYLINNISFSISAGTITLDPADPDNKRTDVIAVNDQGAYVVLKGVADGQNLKPQVDASMLELTYVEIDAGAVTPSINELIIYNENIESVGTSALLAADFNDTTYPKVGAKDVKVTAVQNGGKVMFTLPAPVAVAPFNTLSFFLRLSQNIPTKGKLYAQFYKAGRAISDELALTVNSTLTNEYQFIAIAMTDFHFRSENFDMFQIRYLGSNFNGFYLDYIRLEGGIINPIPTGYSGWYFDVEATGMGLVRQMIKSGENVYFIGKNGLIINRYSHITKGNVIEFELPEAAAGASAYVYIAYASDDAGTGFTLVNNPALAYCAILATDTELLNPVVGDFAGLWYKRLGVDGIDGIDGIDGVDGITPHIGANGHWYLGLVDTGVSAQGQDGYTPYIGVNLHWWINGIDTGILAQGTNGDTPYIGANGNWWIAGVDTGVSAGGGGGQPGGDDTQVQFNDGGAFAGDSGFTFNKVTKKVTIEGRTQGADAVADNEYVTLGQINNMVTPSSNDWVRPDDWLTLPLIEPGMNKFAGLHAVFNHDSNFVAFQVGGGAYTVDWGDGTTDNYAANGIAYKILSYANYPNSECTRGYRQALITITPQAGQTLTVFNLLVKHNQAGLANGYSSGWLDIKMAASTGSFVFSSSNPAIVHNMLERFHYTGVNTMNNFSYAFSNLYNLASIPELYTGASTNFTYCFSGCFSLQSIPLLNTALGTNFTSMFNGCYALRTVPLLNTANGLTFTLMFAACNKLVTIPLLNTGKGTNFQQMFNACTSLESVPLFNTENGTTFASMFYGCYALSSVPQFNLSKAINVSSMFKNCYGLLTIPLFDTALVTNAANMFEMCPSLQTLPSLNFASITTDAGLTAIFNSLDKALSQAAFIGTKVSISYASCKLSAAALVDIFNNLAVVVGKTITITGNWGASLLTAGERAIATGKGWTIVG